MDRWPDGSDRLYGKGSLFFGYDESADAYYLTFPMPYRDGIEVTLFNSGTHAITLTTIISHTAQGYGPGSGYLDIRYVQGDQRNGAFLGDWPNQVLSTTLRGRGKLVGVVRMAKGQIEHCWGRTFLESDELIVVDRAGIDCEQVGAELVCDCEDQGAYVQCGTGMEEFSNGGFYFIHGPFYLPTHGVPLSPPNLLHLPPGPTATCTNRSDSYPLKYKGEVSEREGEDYVETEAIMYRFLLNEAIRFDRSLIVGQEFYFCPDPGSGTTIWGQTDSECRHGMTQTLGLMTIAYIAPNDVFLPLIMKNYLQEGSLSPPSPPGGYPPPPSPTPPPTPTPGGGYPPPPTATPTPDQEPPVSSVDPLPPYQGVLSFTVSWSGSDSGGSGLASYDLQYRDGAINPWTDWLTYTTATSATFSGASSHSYYFRCRARDHANNLEDWPANPDYDTFTTIDTQPPSTTVEAMDLYTSSTSFPVRWHGSDDLSGLHHYDIYYRDESAAFWQSWLPGITATQAIFTGTAGHTYHFCSRGIDQVGNVEPECPPVSTGGEWPIQSDAQTGVTPWSRVDALPAYTAETRFTVSWSGSPGVQTYDVQVRDGQFGLWQSWLTGVGYTAAQFSGQYGHIYYFRCRGNDGAVQEVYPYDYDTYTKLESPEAGGGPSAPPGGISTMPPDEAPDRMEEVTRTHPIGVPLLGYIAPEGDVDWYRFELTETMRLRATLYNLPADYDVYVFGGDGTFLWASTRGYEHYERVVAQIPAGTYYVRLDGYAGAWSQEASYYLLVEEVE
jgi:hypothetical protein